MYSNQELATQLSKLSVLKEIEQLKTQVDKIRPLSKEVEQRIFQKYRLDWNYHSNAIEGNPYTYGETVAFLMEGITAKGKTLKDHLDIKGHDDTIHYLLGVVKDKDFVINEMEIRNLHKMLLKEPYSVSAVTSDGYKTQKEIKLGQYKDMPNHVQTPTGAVHYYASPEETPIKMGELLQWFHESKKLNEIHPLVRAALFHHQFVAIHPFDDGNGRMARLLMNLILMQDGFPPLVVKQQDRNNYYQVLRQADVGDYGPLIQYMGELLVHSLEVYLKGAKGEVIEEMDDVDKEIALFKKSLGEDLSKEMANEDTIGLQIRESIAPLLSLLKSKLEQSFSDLFFGSEARINIGYNKNKQDDRGAYQLFDSLPSSIINAFVRDLFLLDNPYDFDIRDMQFNIVFKGFKKYQEPFDIWFELPIYFDQYKYRINYQREGRLQLNKYYHEILDKDEINQVVKDSINIFFKDLKRRSNHE